MPTKSFIAAAALFAALALPATALAAPGGPDGANVQAHFFDCTGPAGTPTSFDAELQHPGGAWHLTDSRQIFNAMIAFDEGSNGLRPSGGMAGRNGRWDRRPLIAGNACGGCRPGARARFASPAAARYQ